MRATDFESFTLSVFMTRMLTVTLLALFLELPEGVEEPNAENAEQVNLDDPEMLRYLEEVFGNDSNMPDPSFPGNVPPSPKEASSPSSQEISANQSAPEPSVNVGEPMPSIAEEPPFDQSGPGSDPTPSSMPDLVDVASPPPLEPTNGTAAPGEPTDQSNGGQEANPAPEQAAPKNRKKNVLLVDSERRRKRVEPTNNKAFTRRPKLAKEALEVKRNVFSLEIKICI